MFFIPLAAINNRISSLYSGSTLSKRFSSCVIHSAERSFSFMTGSLLILSDKLFFVQVLPQKEPQKFQKLLLSLGKKCQFPLHFSKKSGFVRIIKGVKAPVTKSASKSVVSVCATSEVLEGVIKTGTLSSGKSG